MRTEIIPIEPRELCPGCPEADTCKGTAVKALDSYMKASFFTINTIPNDPEIRVARQYMDAEGGISKMFLAEDQDVDACQGPVVVKRRFLRSDEVQCGAQCAELESMEALSKARTQSEPEPLYLTDEEYQALAGLDSEELAKLASLDTTELNALVRFRRAQ